MNMLSVPYELCKHCDHFVEQEQNAEGESYYIHLDNGEKDDFYEHEATPSGLSKKLSEWKHIRPDLFQENADGLIGPNRPEHPHDLSLRSVAP